MNLVSTKWLNSNLNKVKIFDASWHMPNSKRSAEEEYLEKQNEHQKLLDRNTEKLKQNLDEIEDEGFLEEQKEFLWLLPPFRSLY